MCRRVGTDQSLDALLLRLNPVLRGWCGYFRPGVSYATFAYLGRYTWSRVWHWLRRKHPKATWKQIRRRYFRGGSWPASNSRVLLNPTKRSAPAATGTGEQPSRHPGPMPLS
jgi:RNA-directed DNA polymerase